MSTVRVVVTEADSPDVPGTGAFTAGDSGNMVGIGLMVAVILAAVGVMAVVVMRNRYRACRFMNKGKGFKLSDKGKKIGGLFSILLISATLIVPLTLGGNSTEQVFADEGETDLAITVGNTTIPVQLDNNRASMAYTNQFIYVNSAVSNGYNLVMYATTADLLPQDSSNESVIHGLSGNGTMVLSDNTWGVALSNPAGDLESAVWQAVPTTKATALTLKDVSTSTADGDSTEIWFGTRVTNATKADTYQTTVNYIATANVTTP